MMLTMLLACVSFQNCSSGDDEPSSVSVSTSSVNMGPGSGSQPLSITSNSNWNISGGASWLSVTPSSGSGNSSVTLTVTENKDFTSRNCTLNISTADGNASASVIVTQEAAELALSVDVFELNFSEKEGDIQSLSITSNANWTITGKPEWLDLSSTSGSGNASIKLTTNSFNNSSSERQQTLVVTANGTSIEVKVTQKAGLSGNCTVQLGNIITLSDAVAFSFDYGSSVSYFHVGYLDKSDIGRMTEDEIITVLATKFERYTPSDDYVISFNNLTSLHDYVIYTIAYNKDGKRGELLSKNIRTKSGTNQANAYVDNVAYDNSYWYWDTKIGPYASKYYQWVMTGTGTTDYWKKSDAIVAWRFAQNIEKYPDSFKAIVQDGSWYREREYSERYIQIVTWGVDSSGDFAGVITNERRYISSSSPSVKSYTPSYENQRTKNNVVAVKINDLFDGVKIYRVK